MQLGLLLEVRSLALLHPLVLEHVASLLAQGLVGPLQLDGVGVDGGCLCRGPLRLGRFHHFGLVVDVRSHLSDYLTVVDQLLLRQGVGLSHQLFFLTSVHLWVEEHQLLRLVGLWDRDLLRQQRSEVGRYVGDRRLRGRELVTALDAGPVADLSTLLLLGLSHLGFGVAVIWAGGQVDEPVQGALPQPPGGQLVGTGVLHLLVVSYPDPVGGYTDLPVDMASDEANLVNKEKALIVTYMFAAFEVIIIKVNLVLV